jgi:hypothetical protein
VVVVGVCAGRERLCGGHVGAVGCRAVFLEAGLSIDISIAGNSGE